MSDVVIKVDGVGKQYHLGQVGTGTISHDLNRWWHKVRDKEDPYLKVGEANDRSKKGESDLVWALRDISFEVKQGEVLGIIGRNGAGKSTLLKILSRVTTPSVGEIGIKGRIASLLEVGTGFHPELTGRENIFLNGAILGMSKFEIKSKFDEIVSFSGVERYIDTPVKRYSSGMYVRLAFAVAAHLEPEILIIDEVLAVGDAEFQKKCLGKMKDVSGQGRTVLFVSHNMTAVKTLCDRGVVLSNGTLKFSGSSDEAVTEYFKENKSGELSTSRVYSEQDAPGGDYADLLEYALTNESGEKINSFNVYEKSFIDVVFKIKKSGSKHYPNLHFMNEHEQYVFVFSTKDSDLVTEPGVYKVRFTLNPYTFNTGLFTVGIAITTYPGADVQMFVNPAITFKVEELNLNLRNQPYTGSLPGDTRLQLPYTIQKL